MQPGTAAAILAISALLLSACAGGDGGPTVVLFQDRNDARVAALPDEPPKAAPRTPAPEATATRDIAGGYRVREGDTLYLIARRFNVPIRNLIEANGLVPPYRLAVGQGLMIPTSKTHVVARGETLYGIARRHAVATNEIVRLNSMGPPYTIRPGQVLYLPARIETAAPLQVAARPAKIDVDPVATPIKELAKPVPEPVAAKPRPAEKPQPKEPPAVAKPAPVDSVISPRPPKRPSRTQVAARSVDQPAPPKAKTAKAPNRPLGRGAIPKPPPRSGNKFLWPVRGRVVSGFGPKEKGLHNDGINIAAPRGTPVKAAENGVVAYSGSELRGFGNLVLIRHADGYMTAYGHTGELLVERGQTVRRGQTIAKVGSSGSVSSPQLHFEIRRKKQALNPRRYLDG